MNCLFLLLFAPLFFLASIAQSAEPLRLSLQEAIQQSLSENTAIQIASLKIRESRQSSNLARSALLPQAKFEYLESNYTTDLTSLGLDVSGIPGIPSFAFPRKLGPTEFSDLRFQVAVNVIDVSALLRFQASRQKIHLSEIEKEKIENDIMAAVATLYVSVQKAQAKIEEIQSNIRLFKKLRDLAQSQLKVGVGTALDLQRSELQLANQLQALLVAKEQEHTLKLTLLHAIGADLGVELILTDSLQEQKIILPSLEDSLETAKRERPELRSLMQSERISKTLIGAEKMKRFPVLSALFQGGWSGSGLSDELIYTRRMATMVSVPLLTGGRLRAELKQAELEHQHVALKHREADKQVEEEVRRARVFFETSTHRVKVAKQGLSLARKELEFAKDRYTHGVANSLELESAQNQLVNSQELYWTALADQAQSFYEFQRATGKIRDWMRERRLHESP